MQEEVLKGEGLMLQDQLGRLRFFRFGGDGIGIAGRRLQQLFGSPTKQMLRMWSSREAEMLAYKVFPSFVRIE